MTAGEEDKINDAINNYYANAIAKATPEDQQAAIAQYGRMHNATYDNGKWYALNDDGSHGAELEGIDLEQITADYISGVLSANLANMNQFEIATMINEQAGAGNEVFDEAQLQEFYRNAQEEWRKDSFTKEADARGLDLEELQDYAGYLAKIAAGTEK